MGAGGSAESIEIIRAQNHPGNLYSKILTDPKNYAMENLFSYGTLQFEKVQLKLFDRRLDGSKDVLNGYTLATIPIDDDEVLATSELEHHFIAVRSENEADGVDGFVYTIAGEELLVADSYETEDYKRVKLRLRSGREAWVYVAR